MSQPLSASILSHFAALEDPRQHAKVLYPLVEILLLALAATIAGADDFVEVSLWGEGFVCPDCQAAGEPFRFVNRPGVLRCRKCRHDVGLTAATVMERTHTPLSV
jgi:hypothetical protein